MPVWTLEQALVAVLYSAACVDDDVDEREREQMLAFERRSRTLRNMSPEELRAVNREVVDRLRYGEGSLAAACAALPPELRLGVFAQALDVLLADGALKDTEADFVNTLLLELKLDGQDVAGIAEVLAIKNSV